MVSRVSTLSTVRLVSTPGPETDRDGFYAAGFWGPRGESPDSAAHRLKQFLDKLKPIHPLLAEWYFGVMEKGAPRVATPISEAGLREWIIRQVGWTREGLSGNSADGRGAMLGAWAGDYSASASLSARFGNTNERVGNAVVLNLPRVLDPLLTNISGSRSLLDAIVLAWDPDRAVVRPDDVLRSDAPTVRPGEIARAETYWKRFPDWIVYKRGEPLVLGGPFKDRAS